MSRSIKISSMDQVEDYINRQNRQLTNLERQLSGVAEQAREEASREAERRASALRTEMERMDENFTSQIKGVESDMAEMDRQHRHAMKEQAKDLYRDLNNLKGWTEHTITELEGRVSASFGKQQKQIDTVRQSVNRLYEKEANESNKANKMLKDLHALIDAVQKNTFHDKYAPGELAKLRRRLDDLANSKDPAASLIAGARNITNSLWDMEEGIFKAQAIFEALHNLVLTEATELLEIMNRNRNNTCFTDEDGEILKDQNGTNVKVEVDYWTMGEYGKQEQRAVALKHILEIEKNSPQLTEEKLKDILTEINEIKERQNEMVKQAIQRGLASEERVKISEDIINAMEEQGFQLKKMQNGIPAHNYLGGEQETDPREGVFAILKNHRTETEVTIIVHPDESFTKNNIVFQRNDDSTLTHDELARSIEEVKKTIEKQGYEMGGAASPKGTGDNRQAILEDAAALAKTGIERDLKEQLGFITKQTVQKR